MSIGRQLVETDINLIIQQIKDNIASALIDVMIERDNNVVTYEPPNDYFIYPKAKGYRCPVVFVIADRTDFRKDQVKANYISAVNKIVLSVLVEDKDAERIYKKAYRYQAALHACVDQVVLTSADEAVKITIVVMGASFSPLMSNTQDPNDPATVFRKEVVLELDVHHYESLNLGGS